MKPKIERDIFTGNGLQVHRTNKRCDELLSIEENGDAISLDGYTLLANGGVIVHPQRRFNDGMNYTIFFRSLILKSQS